MVYNTADHTIVMCLAGGRFRIRTSCAQTMQTLENMFSYHSTDDIAEAGFEHEVCIRHRRVDQDIIDLLDNANDPWLGRTAIDIPVMAVRDSDKGIALKIGDEAYSYTDIGRHKTVCYLKPECSGDASICPQPWVYLLPILQALLALYGIYVIHSAAVTYEDKALLLLGESGAGKTTMCLALARAGMAYMGDDLVGLQRHENTIYAHAILLRPKLVIDESGEKCTVDAVADERLACMRFAPVGALVHLQRSVPELKQTARMQRPQMMSQLLSMGNSPVMTNDMKQWFDTVFELSQQVPGWIWSPPFPDADNIDAVFGHMRRMMNIA
ncbi:hypothetical protein LLG46_13675 [bacterium]|nr:hypothetical protein [bacterium]